MWLLVVVKSGETESIISRAIHLSRNREHAAKILHGILCPITLLPSSVMATAYGLNKFSSSISQVGLQLLTFIRVVTCTILNG